MIDHLRSNKGKIFMYILPVKPYPHKVVTDYIILKVQLVNIHNNMSEMKILDIIREESGNGVYAYLKKRDKTTWGSNSCLFPITKEEK